MKYERIDKRLFERNRTKFMQQMKENTVAVFNSNDIYPISADSSMPFEQHRDIFYLSGVDQEESILVLFPDASDPKHREVLFLKETNDHIAVWEGEKLTKEAAFESTGVKTVYWLQEFDTIFKQMMAEAEGVYFNTNEHLRANTETQTREDRFIKKYKKIYPAHQVHKSAPILHRIRSVKEDIELDLMQKACDITEKAYKRVLKFIEPGVWEHEIEAEIIHEFIRNRSNGFAYTPIIASGKNACVLHYVENNQECKDGDVILMDFGAKYANYASDQTRSVPVSGRYSARQKEVYNAVLHVKKEAEKLLVPGTLIPEYHKEVGHLMEEQLLKLNLLDKTDIKNQDPNWPAYKKYFMHGTSHFIGLDTHDSGLYHKPIEAGMVFTCEPGIYIPEENLGIRLEDDLIIQDGKAPKNMMPGLPLELEEIEDYMNS
ncbi:aminopeptidase P family protein [Brumimicrobium oceani]|uniref:Xaa-Pro aminopeptidase n=1 Tax=Brumimicrobium oceani TaxID=2100725 RepID=A0A2U2XCC2_9FLAO|nr:aminopeptidase P family protein [Brumimicrobium oceani]PWH85445.1 X-Pro aminopeptidase [Brumimicrobium oceani]